MLEQAESIKVKLLNIISVSLKGSYDYFHDVLYPPRTILVPQILLIDSLGTIGYMSSLYCCAYVPSSVLGD